MIRTRQLLGSQEMADGTRVTRIRTHPEGTLLAVESELRITPVLLRLYFSFVKRTQWQRATDDWLERVRAEFAGSSDHLP